MSSISNPFIKFQKNAVKRIVWPYSFEQDSLYRWRAIILSSIIIAGLFFGLFAFIAAAVLILKNNAWGLAAVDSAGIILCLIFLFVHRIRFEIRASISLLMFFVIGAAVILTMGPLSGGPAWLFAFAVLAGVLMGNFAAFLAILMNAIFIVIIGILISTGKFGTEFPFFKTPHAMIAAGVNFVVLNAITAVSVSAVVKGVFQLFKKTEKLAMGLEKERIQLTKAQQFLESEIKERKLVETRLKKSDETHRNFIDNAPIGMYTTNLRGEFTYANKKLEEITGYKKEDWLHKSFHPIVFPDDLIQVENKIKLRVERKLETDSHEIRIFNSENELRWIKITSESIFDDTDRSRTLIGVQSFVEDITKVKHSQNINKTLFAISNAVNTTENLTDLYQQIHHLLGEIFDVTNFFIVIVDTKENTLHFPYHVDTVDKDYSSIHHFNESDSLSGLVVSQRKPILLKGKALLDRSAKKGIQGSIPLIWMGVPLIIKESVIGVIALQSYTDANLYTDQDLQILSSVSDQVAIAIERKRAQDALHENERKYRHLFNNAPAGMYEIDFINVRFTKVNKVMCNYSGYSEDEFLSMNPMDFLTKEGQRRFAEKFENHVGGGKKLANNTEYSILKKNGEELSVVLNSDFIFDKEKLIGARVVVHDITERKKIEAMMIQSEKMMSVGGLAAGMAHEINNPLAGIMQNGQVIYNRLTMDLPANTKAAEELGISMPVIKHYMEKRGILKQLDNIHQAGSHAAKIIENMLSFARKSDLTKSEHCLAELIDKTIDLAKNDYNLKKKYDFKEIKIIREYEADVPNIFCEASKIQQVLFNVIKNASEAMINPPQQKDAPEIIFRLKKQMDRVCVEIEDNGPGMDQETQKRIFEPFFTTKSVDEGTGLGLSVSYFIVVEDHKGEMAVESSSGVGTKFIITLPLTGS